MPDAPTPQPQSPSKPALPPEIGGYMIQRILGSGGMATVYAALQRQPRRTVALKVMNASLSLARGDAAIRRFRREIEILGKLHHPYIAQVYDAGVHIEPGGAAVPFFVMEFVSNARTILEYVSEQQVEQRERLKLFVKVCAAVEHGHVNKIVHRDLKPGNILIDQHGEPKVIDFGVAHAGDPGVPAHTACTQQGDLVGTVLYMSPEQTDSRLVDLDARCDVYALGVLLYKLLTGRMPHDLKDLPVYEAVRIIRERMPAPPSSLKPELKGDLETIILKAIERDRERRYKNAGSLGRDIVRYLATQPINARRASLAYRAGLFARRHRPMLAASLIVLLVMGVATAIVMRERAGARDERGLVPQDHQPPPRTMLAPAADSPQAQSPNATNIASPQRAAFILRAHAGRVTALAFAPRRPQVVATGSEDHTLALWDAPRQQMLASLARHQTAVRHLAFSRDGRRLAAASDAGPAIILDAESGSVLHTISAGGRQITSVALNDDGSTLALGCDDLTLRVQPTTGGVPSIIRSTTGAFTCLDVRGDGPGRRTLMAAGSRSGAVLVWELESLQLLRRFEGLGAEVMCVAILPASADGGLLRVLAVSAEGDVTIWPLGGEVGSRQAPLRFRAGAGRLGAACVDAAGARLACASPGDVQVWDVRDVARPAARLRPAEPVTVLALDADGGWCACGRADGDVEMIPINP